MQSESQSAHAIRVGILAISLSDKLLDDVGLSAWERSGGATLEEALPKPQYNLIRPLVVPGGNRAEVASILRDWCDAPNKSFCCQLILTLGGDGFAQRDVVPEATRDILERETFGIAEHLRRFAMENYDYDGTESGPPHPALTRGTAGIRRQTLVVNLPSCFPDPGSAFGALLRVLPGAIQALNTGE